MLTLYTKPGCPYCGVVLNKLEELKVPFEEKSIWDHGVAEELVARGGKRQVPYLADGERGVEMYESRDIVSHLEEHYGQGKNK